jgi:hypothetical protein
MGKEKFQLQNSISFRNEREKKDEDEVQKKEERKVELS